MSPLNTKHHWWHSLPKDRDFTSPQQHLPESSRIWVKSPRKHSIFFLLTFCGSWWILAHGCAVHGGAQQRLDVYAELWFLEKLHFHVAVVPLHIQYPLTTMPQFLHLRHCAEDFLPICSPNHPVGLLRLTRACALCMAEERDYHRGHFPASAPSQVYPLRCPGPTNQWKKPHSLETRGLRMQREEVEGTVLRPADGPMGRAYLNSHLLPRCWAPQPNPLLSVGSLN